MMGCKLLLSLLFFPLFTVFVFGQSQPLKVGIAGLTHTHVHGILGREASDDIEIVGIAEPNRELAQRYATQYGFSMELVFPSLEEMINATKPEAVTAFGTIYEHLGVVETCAPKGIHVMVEKPLAISLDHAKKMESLARKHNVHLLTNYETTWYPSNHGARELLKEGKIGELRKVVINDGHKGPVRIGINTEFLDWLTDPEQNGAGALMDFGCYGANLMTWLLDGQRPLSVTAVTQQLQPDNNPKVDDDATIILTYDTAMAVLQPSWNWPIGRKDMEVYGTEGVLYADNKNDLRMRISEGYDGFTESVPETMPLTAPFNDPFALLSAVVKGSVTVDANDLSSLENNMIVMEILEAAMESAKAHQTINLQH